MTEKQYRIQEYLNTNPGPHTAKEIGVGCGRKKDLYTYAKSALAKLETQGRVARIARPCQPVRWQWIPENQISTT